MMSRIDAHAVAKNTFRENFSVQKYLTIIVKFSLSLKTFSGIGKSFQLWRFALFQGDILPQTT